MQLLKHMFKKMDPSVMKTNAEKTHGDIQLSFKYEATRELLLIKVIKCRDLSAKDLRGKTADPYVQVKNRQLLRLNHYVHSELLDMFSQVQYYMYSSSKRCPV